MQRHQFAQLLVFGDEEQQESEMISASVMFSYWQNGSLH